MLQVPMPIASLVRDHFLSGQARGESSSDWAGLTGIAARNSGLFRRDQGTRESIV
jgi:hypothetical protein